MTKQMTVFLILIISACGAGTSNGQQGRVSSSFSEDDARVFDNSVDLVRSPGELLGRWREQWAQDLSQRGLEADVIGIVRIDQIRESVDLQRVESFQLGATITRLLVGEDSYRTLTMTVRESEAGYDTVEHNQSHILEHDFIVFVKWAQENDAVVARWHLVPASDTIINEVESALLHRRRVDRQQTQP